MRENFSSPDTSCNKWSKKNRKRSRSEREGSGRRMAKEEVRNTSRINGLDDLLLVFPADEGASAPLDWEIAFEREEK